MQLLRRFTLLAALTLPALPCDAQLSSITQYSLTPPSAVGNICTGPDGNAWLIFNGISAVGKITPTGSVTAFPYPLTGLTLTPSLVGCAFGPDSKLYFSDQNNKKVVAFDPTTLQFVTRNVPAPNSGIAGLAFGADGNAYMMVSGSSAIQRMTTAGTFLPVIQLVAGRYPHGPSGCADGNVWFAEHNANRIAKVNTSGQVTEILLPQASSLPFSTACGPDGVYFTQEAGRIGRVNYATLQITQWKTANSKSRPTGMAINGNVHFSESGIGKIGIMPVGGGTITEIPVPRPGSFPDKITLGSDGRVWFSYHDLAEIGAMQ
jgi:virginiamycin B lyase